MSRKYRSKGYMDDDSDRQRPRRQHSDAPARGRVETRFRRTIRCSECSAPVTFMDEIQISDTCTNCGADLHTCRNCKFFDPGAANECMRDIPARIESKNTRNICTLFSPKVLVEKAVERRKETRSDDARKAFDDLFK